MINDDYYSMRFDGDIIINPPQPSGHYYSQEYLKFDSEIEALWREIRELKLCNQLILADMQHLKELYGSHS